MDEKDVLCIISTYYLIFSRSTYFSEYYLMSLQSNLMDKKAWLKKSSFLYSLKV
jgi:hypothetical protein